MNAEDPKISLTPIEVELLLASLAHYEQKFRDGRPEHLSENIRMLRQKLLDIP